MQRTVVRLTSTISDSAWLQLPCDYATATSKKYPVLIFINGREEGSDFGGLTKLLRFGPPKFMADSLRFSFNSNNQVYNMIVIAPQSRAGFRNPLQINQIIDNVVATYRVDPSRIYLTGLSAGAHSVLQYLTDKPEYTARIASAAIVSATELDDTHTENLKYIASAKVPVHFYVGQQDTRYYSLNKGYADKINALSAGLAGFVDYEGGHGNWNRVYDVSQRYFKPNMYEWMLQHHK